MGNRSNDAVTHTARIYTVSANLHRAAEWLRENKQPDVVGKIYSGTAVTKLAETRRSTVSRIVPLYSPRIRQWNIPGCIYRVSESGDLLRINSYRTALPPHLLKADVMLSVSELELISNGINTLMTEK